ncbi:hypothetical protein ON010_g17735 [Phytophthora cinnamomi]|nr:hypothetical protein ON010_g17735 [Phytophthora cinnamomi]
MKVISTLVYASVLVGSVSAILGGQKVPQGRKTYTTGLRTTVDPTSADDFSFCGGALISPTHVLTRAPRRPPPTSCRWARTTSTAARTATRSRSSRRIPTRTLTRTADLRLRRADAGRPQPVQTRESSDYRGCSEGRVGHGHGLGVALGPKSVCR